MGSGDRPANIHRYMFFAGIFLFPLFCGLLRSSKDYLSYVKVSLWCRFGVAFYLVSLFWGELVVGYRALSEECCLSKKTLSLSKYLLR
jgi:hypothetical protein